jgi:hypothetical protein
MKGYTGQFAVQPEAAGRHLEETNRCQVSGKAIMQSRNANEPG